MEPRLLVLNKEDINHIQGFENSESNSTILFNEDIKNREIKLNIPSGQRYREYYIENNTLKLIFDH